LPEKKSFHAIAFSSIHHQYWDSIDTMELQEYIPNQIWTCKYPVHYAGCDFTGRMTVIRLANGYLMLPSPCQIDADLKQAIQALGEVGYIVAPGSFHHPLENILSWDFQRIIVSHGDLIEHDARDVARQAWAKPLSGE
jgi:hypothetical protein